MNAEVIRKVMEDMSIPVTEVGCWIWMGSQNNRGYGLTNKAGGGKTLLAHRVAFSFLVRELAEGEVVCHKCDTPLCVNPDHLFAGSLSDNMIDCSKKKRLKNPNTPKSVVSINIDTLEKTRYAHAYEAERFGFSRRCICDCCNGKQKTHKGRSWSYE